MIAVAAPSTESVVSDLPSLSSTDHDNTVMIEKGDTSDSSQMMSPLKNNDSFDHWQKENEWDDVVIIMGNDESGDAGCHLVSMEEVFAEADDKHPSQTLLDSTIVMVEANAAPFIDEFLVGCNDNNNKQDTEADLNQYSRDFQVPRSTKHFSRGDFGNARHPGSKYNKKDNGTASSKAVKTLTPQKCYSAVISNEVHSNFVRAPSYTNLALPSLSPPSKRSMCSPSFKDLYRKRLQRLKESIHQSRKSRRSLRMSSPRVTERYSRRTSVSRVLFSIECSSRRIDACYLDPAYLDRGMQSPPKSKSTTQRQPKAESATALATKEEKPAMKASLT